MYAHMYICVCTHVCKYMITKGDVTTMIMKMNKVKAVGPDDVMMAVWR